MTHPTIKKLRIFELAKSLGLDTKAVLDYARDLGYDVKNQLSSLEGDQVNAVKARIARGGRPGPAAAPARPTPLRRVENKIHRLSEISSQVSLVHGASRIGLVSADYPGLDKLFTVGEAAGLGKLDRIGLVAEIDPEAAMFKIRKLTEQFCKLLVRPDEPRDLNQAIELIEKRKILNEKAVNYLHHVRKGGNIAVHTLDEAVDDQTSLDDVNIAAMTLAVVIEAAVKRGAILTKSNA